MIHWLGSSLQFLRGEVVHDGRGNVSSIGTVSLADDGGWFGARGWWLVDGVGGGDGSSKNTIYVAAAFTAREYWMKVTSNNLLWCLPSIRA